MNKPSKADIAAIARRLWRDESERRAGRCTVRAVLEAYRKRILLRRARNRPYSPNVY